MSSGNTERILTNYNQFLINIETNVNNDIQKRNELEQRIEEM